MHIHYYALDPLVQEIVVSDINPETLKRVAAECPGYQARATARVITRYYNACFKPVGLTAEQFSLLVGIGAADGATVVDLAASAGVDATTLSRNVQNLEARGLVLAEGGRGRAGKRLSLTDDGRGLMAQAFTLWAEAKAELARRMGDDKLIATREAMADLANAAGAGDL